MVYFYCQKDIAVNPQEVDIMTMTTRKNNQVKALQSIMARAKKHDYETLIEWELSCNTNSQRGHVYNQLELLKLYDRYGNNHQGCSKAVHLMSHKGHKFKYIVLKRHKRHGYIPDVRQEHSKCTGNQLIDEIACWQEFVEREESDYLCPILKFFTSKSDQVRATSETMLENVVIIAQKAVYVDDLRSCCRHAENLNSLKGYTGEDADTRYEKMKRFAKKQSWRDAVGNPGNCGVIFDYSKQCYKAVFIDYAL